MSVKVCLLCGLLIPLSRRLFLLLVGRRWPWWMVACGLWDPSQPPLAVHLLGLHHTQPVLTPDVVLTGQFGCILRPRHSQPRSVRLCRHLMSAALASIVASIARMPTASDLFFIFILNAKKITHPFQLNHLHFLQVLHVTTTPNGLSIVKLCSFSRHDGKL